MLDVAALFRDHADAVLRYLARHLDGDPEAADDLASVVWTRAWEHRHRYHPVPGATPTSWLFTIAHHALVDEYRHRASAAYARTTTLDAADRHRATADAGSDRHLDAVLAHAILDTLTAERPQQAAVIRLRFLAGLEHADVAARLGISLESSHKLQVRALARSRRIAHGDLSRFGGVVIHARPVVRTCRCGATFETATKAVHCSRACRKRAYVHRAKLRKAG